MRKDPVQITGTGSLHSHRRDSSHFPPLSIETTTGINTGDIGHLSLSPPPPQQQHVPSQPLPPSEVAIYFDHRRKTDGGEILLKCDLQKFRKGHK